MADFDRPLNARGKRDAPFMGERLKKARIKPDLIVSSPANRAITTAEIIAEIIGFPISDIVTRRSIYDGDAGVLLRLIQNLGSSITNAMLIGHNPEITSVASYLTNYPVSNIPTCGIFAVDFDIESWTEVSEGTGKLIFFDFPKKHP